MISPQPAAIWRLWFLAEPQHQIRSTPCTKPRLCWAYVLGQTAIRRSSRRGVMGTLMAGMGTGMAGLGLGAVMVTVSDDGFRCGRQTDESRRLPRGRDGCWAAASHGSPVHKFRHTGAQARWQGHELKPAHHDGGRFWVLPITPSTLPASRFSSFCHTTIAPRERGLERAWKRLVVLARWKKVFSLFFSQPSFQVSPQPPGLTTRPVPDHQRLRAQLTNPRHRIPYPSPLSVEIGVGTDRNLVKGETHQMTLKNEPIAP